MAEEQCEVRNEVTGILEGALNKSVYIYFQEMKLASNRRKVGQLVT